MPPLKFTERTGNIKPDNERLLSLDLFRGITMLLLIAEGTNIFHLFNAAVPENSFLSRIFLQLYHAKWNGMHFWDLIQPYFTFIVGVAMAFSLKKRWERGTSWALTFKHMLFRCIVLFLLGIVLQSVYKEKPAWELWNILTQLSVSILISFLIFRFSFITQLGISFFLLFAMEMLYRYVLIDGFNQPLVLGKNFGAFIDMALMGKTHPDGWVAINCIPTTAHMIWGVLTGKVLINNNDSTKKIRILGLTFLVALIVGYGMDWAGISTINKKISTSSFVIASGGWSLASFLILYWFVDVKGYKRWIQFIVILGMNPIFIYIFSRTIGRSYLNEYVPVFTDGMMGWFISSEGLMNLITYMTIIFIQWYLCYWLYKRKIFIKL